MITADITQKLLETGMMQFGEFRENKGGYAPLRLHLELLPAYPTFLGQVTGMLGELLPGNIQRLVAAPDALPLGVSVSLRTGIPLIYSRGIGESPAFDLVGAYDSGRAAAVLMNAFSDSESLLSLIWRVRKVGLNVSTVMGLIDFESGFSSDCAMLSLVNLTGVMDALNEKALIPAGQITSVYEWIRQNRGQ